MLSLNRLTLRYATQQTSTEAQLNEPSLAFAAAAVVQQAFAQ